MINTRFMQRLFSATEERDEELTNQVANDIESAKQNGVVDTDEVVYENAGDGRVAITDKGNGEVTMAEQAEDGNYDLYPAQVSQQIEGFIHPEGDGVTPGQQMGAPDEHVEYHLDGSSVISPNLPDGGLNMEAGHERSVEELAAMMCADGGCGEKEFSVYTENTAVQKIFSDQVFCERVFSEVIESEETAKVGDLKVEKEDDNSVIVTSESTGDQARVTLDGDEMEVTELDSKNFSYYNDCYPYCDESMAEGSENEDGDFYGGSGDYEQLHVVGVDPVNHVIVDSPEYDPESAQELVQRLGEQGVVGCQILDNHEDARSYAMQLLANLGAEEEGDIDEPEEATFSDVDGYWHDVYVTKYYSSNTDYMDRLFSETGSDIDASQSEIEEAIENGDQVENGSEIITPIDDQTAVVEDKDNGEYTLVTVEDELMNAERISKNKAIDLLENAEVNTDDDDDDDEEEGDKNFSDIWVSDDMTRYFSENESLTYYMTRLFSGDADESAIEDAIENGDQVENEDEVITPVDAKTAVIEDKETGEFTKAVLEDGDIEVSPISEEEADTLTENLAVEDEGEDEDEDESEKDFSDIWVSDDMTRYFSEDERMSDFMIRLFSGDADESAIEDAIENGDQVENEDEVITPVDAKTAIVEDKESGEFTKAILEDGEIELTPISEEEADTLTENLAVEDEGEDEDEDKKEKTYSKFENNHILDKFFADALQQQQMMAPQGQMDPAMMQGQMPMDPAVAQQPMDPSMMQQDPAMQGQMPMDPAMMQGQAPAQPSVESIEDKAVAAVQQIQAAASEAEAAIMNAKAAPAQNVEPDLQEAQFSWYGEGEAEDRFFTENVITPEACNDTLVSWLIGTKYGKK